MENSYKYASLDPSTSEIRLLTLEAGRFDDPIQCHVHHVYLDEKPSYEALSYVWGDATITRDIRVSGHPFAITINLEIALRSLRLADEARVLWVDAICINQSDIPERNSQVQKMRDIYTSASKVLSWLGEANDNSDEAMADIEDIARIFAMNEDDMPLPTGTPEQFEELHFNFDGRNWGAIVDLLSRKYWTRVWILQELAASGPMGSIIKSESSRGIIGCGSAWMSKHLLDKFVLFIGYLGRSTNNFLESGEFKEPFHTITLRFPIPALQIYSILAYADEYPHIAQLLVASKFLDATDPRDKVFALLGMAKELSGFSPDYSSSKQQVYKKLMSTIILQDHNLACLCGNETVEGDFSPSWAMPKSDALQVGLAWKNTRGFNYASGTEQTDAHFDPDLNLLHCSGVLIGSIQTVIGPLGAGPLITAFEDLYAYARNAEEPHREAIWRTLVMDQDNFDFDNPVSPAPAAFEKQYKVLVENATVPQDFAPDAPDDQRQLMFVERYLRNFDESITYRCFFAADSGHLGVGPYLTKKGDVVAVLTGGNFCFVLRPKGEHFQVVGEAYVYGVMKGELMKRDENGILVNGREFVLC